MNRELDATMPAALRQLAFDHFELIRDEIFFRAQSRMNKFAKIFDGRNVGR